MKRKNTEILLNLGFKVIKQNYDQVYLDSPGEDEFGSIVQAVVYSNNAGSFSVSLDGGFQAPAYENEELLLNYLNEDFPGWKG